MKSVIRYALAAGLLGLALPAHAAPVVDQEQPNFSSPLQTMPIDGGKYLAYQQHFTAGVTSDLIGVRLAIGNCADSNVTVNIYYREEDGSAYSVEIGSSSHPGMDLTAAPATLTEFLVSTPIPITTGRKYSVYYSTDKYCETAAAPAGDPYSGGEGYGTVDVTYPDPAASDVHILPLLDSFLFPGYGAEDLVFQTLVESGPPPPAPPLAAGPSCTITPAGGGAPVDIDYYAPICRCLSDRTLLELRCAILHPDFFAIRRIPLPLTPGKPYEEIWQILPYTKLDGPINFTLSGKPFEKPVSLEYTPKRLRTYDMKSALSLMRSQSGKAFKVKAIAPESAAAGSAMAVFEYPMEDAEHEIQKHFGVKMTLPEEAYKN